MLAGITDWGWTTGPSLLGAADLEEGQQHVKYQCIRPG
jgi:hypothetical protein